GDILPDERRPLMLPDLEETQEPIFALRGILPFHDFTEGPDWWEADDYKAYLAQLVKLRMNFLGMHCYPEGGVGPEPLVWIGHPDEVDSGGKVSSSYPSRWASTDGGAWGYAPRRTSDFAAGANLLFAADEFGPSVTAGHRPTPTTAAGANEVFQRAAMLLSDVFDFGRPLGMKYCLGTESPLTIPKAVQARLRARGLDPEDSETIKLLYQGMFERLERTHGADYYWLWTPEGWTWSGTTAEQVEATIRDIQLAAEALAEMGAPMQLATCGWVLGPPGNRALFDEVLDQRVPLSCINRQVGFDPVEPAFSVVKGRPTWAIPWLEDDPAMIIPQLWAGRMRRDAADAAAYGCAGLIGIHWRTRILDPNIAALAQAAWAQEAWNADFGAPAEIVQPRTKDVHDGGATADYANNAIVGADAQRVYQTCRWNVDGYAIDVPPGLYRVTLKFCEVHYREAGKRVFGIKLQGEQVVEGLDVFARVGSDTALDLSFADVEVAEAGLLIDFTREVEYPFIAGIEVVGADASATARRINCGGGMVESYEADLPVLGSFPELASRDRDLPCVDFYHDWARAQFGEAVATEAAALFASLDGGAGAYQQGKRTHLPRPSDWRAGPGGIVINSEPWERERARYAFIAELEALRPRVQGEANRERFDYWLNTFRFLRAVGEAGCRRGELDALVQRLDKVEDATARQRLAREEALPVRLRLARVWEEMLTLQLQVVSTPGELGTIANLEQHVRGHNQFLSGHDERLAAWLGEALPAAVEPGGRYRGEPRLIVPTVRTVAVEGERLRLRAIVLSHGEVERLTARWRPLGRGAWREVSGRHLGRGVYELALPGLDGRGLEYVLEAEVAGRRLRWPATQEGVGQTVTAQPAAG
ncbi:MAG: malectin domain-containing carbohydrate-binding protein, partial [Phycisphaerales bacterium JB038]